LERTAAVGVLFRAAARREVSARGWRHAEGLIVADGVVYWTEALLVRAFGI
jgi:hypothetical protein